MTEDEGLLSLITAWVDGEMRKYHTLVEVFKRSQEVAASRHEPGNTKEAGSRATSRGMAARTPPGGKDTSVPDEANMQPSGRQNANNDNNNKNSNSIKNNDNNNLNSSLLTIVVA